MAKHSWPRRSSISVLSCQPAANRGYSALPSQQQAVEEAVVSSRSFCSKDPQHDGPALPCQGLYPVNSSSLNFIFLTLEASYHLTARVFSLPRVNLYSGSYSGRALSDSSCLAPDRTISILLGAPIPHINDRPSSYYDSFRACHRLIHGSLFEPQDIECGRGSAETFELQPP